MALVLKTAPVDIDIVINAHQNYLFGKVLTDDMVNSTDWESYPRVYQNPWKKGKTPELYLGNGEYREVFYDDRYKMTSFYIVSNNRPIVNGIVETEVSLIVQADIEKLFTSVSHRADEELNNLFGVASEDYFSADQFRLDGIVTGVENVYREFITDDVKLDDMSNQYVVRFDYTVRYEPSCCADC